jgi:hypothetical protein
MFRVDDVRPGSRPADAQSRKRRAGSVTDRHSGNPQAQLEGFRFEKIRVVKAPEQKRYPFT